MVCSARVLAGALLAVSLSFAQAPRWRVVQTHQAPGNYEILGSTSSGFAAVRNQTSPYDSARMNPDGSMSPLTGIGAVQIFEDGSVVGYSGNLAYLWRSPDDVQSIQMPTGVFLGGTHGPTGASLWFMDRSSGMNNEVGYMRSSPGESPQWLGSSYDGISPRFVGDNGAIAGAKSVGGQVRLAVWQPYQTYPVLLSTPGMITGSICSIDAQGTVTASLRRSDGNFLMRWDANGAVQEETFVASAMAGADDLRVSFDGATAPGDGRFCSVQRGSQAWERHYWSPSTGLVPLRSLVEGLPSGFEIGSVKSFSGGRAAISLRNIATGDYRHGYALQPVPEPMSLISLCLGPGFLFAKRKGRTS